MPSANGCVRLEGKRLERWRARLEIQTLDLASPSDLHQLLEAFVCAPRLVWRDRRAEIYHVLESYSGYVGRFRRSISELQRLALGTEDWEVACESHGADPLAGIGKMLGSVHRDADAAWLIYCFLDLTLPLISHASDVHPLSEIYLQLEMFVAGKRGLARPGGPMNDWLLMPMLEPSG